MTDKPQLKISKHIVSICVSVLLWIGIITVCLLLTACQFSAIAPAPKTAALPKKGAVTEYDIVYPPAPGTATWAVTAYALNVRSCPSTTCKVIRILDRGEVVTIREWSKTGSGWAMIAPAEWVNGDFLYKEKP